MIRHCVAITGNDYLREVERRATAKGIRHSMDVHDKVFADKTLKLSKPLLKPNNNCTTEQNLKQLKKNIYKYLNALMYIS